MEIWKDISGYEGLYQVSTCGRIKSLSFRNQKTTIHRIVILKPKTDVWGYIKVVLCKNGITKDASVHRLVAEAFMPNLHNYPCVNHKDENKQNNNIDNLEWCTVQYNTCYNNNNYKKRTYKRCPIAQFTLNGELVKVWLKRIDIYRDLGFDRGYISLCCDGKIKAANGYVWKYLNDCKDLIPNREVVMI